MSAKNTKKKTLGSINVVVHTVIVCKLQGLKARAVVKQSSGDGRKSKMLKGGAPSQKYTV